MKENFKNLKETSLSLTYAEGKDVTNDTEAKFKEIFGKIEEFVSKAKEMKGIFHKDSAEYKNMVKNYAKKDKKFVLSSFLNGVTAALPTIVLILLASSIKYILEEGMIISGLDNVIDIANYLFDKVKDVVIITLADEGAYYKTKESFGYINGKKQKAVDTTGAGDIFFGTFLNEYLKEEYNISAAIKKANIAAGLSVLKKGAIPSIPNINELEKIDD